MISRVAILYSPKCPDSKKQITGCKAIEKYGQYIGEKVITKNTPWGSPGVGFIGQRL